MVLTGFVGGSVGLSVVILTVLVKSAILPLSHKSIKTQSNLRKIDPEIRKIKEKHKNNQQDQAKATMELYKMHGINPFSGCLLTLIQIPIIFGLYWVFWKGLLDIETNKAILYSFVDIPTVMNFYFLGINLVEKNITVSILAGVSQFFLMKLSMPPIKIDDKKSNETQSFSDEFKKGLSTQARYVLPVVIAVVSLNFHAVVPLYWLTSNLFSLGHELLVRRSAKKLLSQA